MPSSHSTDTQLAVEGYVVELLFDPALEARIDAIRRELHQQGLSAELDPTPPHISIGAADTLWVRQMQGALDKAAQGLAPIPVSFGGIASFPGEKCVVYLTPGPSEALFTHHGVLHNALVTHGTNLDKYYLPGTFVPHATIAKGVSPEEIARLEEVVQAKSALPLEGEIQGVGLYIIGRQTDNEVCRFQLRGERF